VRRRTLNLALKNELEREQIELRERWQLRNIIEKENGVVAVAVDGRIEEGSFLIGCDGIKSVTRSLILAQHGLSPEDASFTGLAQVNNSLLVT
jgi:salicylate hydroxylase